MKFFPLTILDDFFENPDEVLKLAEEVDYQNTGQNSFPGQVSNLTLDKINGVSIRDIEKLKSLKINLNNLS